MVTNILFLCDVWSLLFYVWSKSSTWKTVYPSFKEICCSCLTSHLWEAMNQIFFTHWEHKNTPSSETTETTTPTYTDERGDLHCRGFWPAGSLWTFVSQIPTVTLTSKSLPKMFWNKMRKRRIESMLRSALNNEKLSLLLLHRSMVY